MPRSKPKRVGHTLRSHPNEGWCIDCVREGERKGLLRAAQEAERRWRFNIDDNVWNQAEWCREQAKKLRGKHGR